MITQQKINSDNYYICSLYKRASFSNFFLGTFMKFSSAEEIDGRIIHLPDGESEHQDG